MEHVMRTHRRFFLSTILALTGVAAFTGLPARGDSYPSKPVKILLQAAPGTAPDVLGRMIAVRLTQTWGQQLLMVNRPGGGGLLAAQAAVAAEPDGYTLYQATTSSLQADPSASPSWRKPRRRMRRLCAVCLGRW
jgi:tripartite-type tricarboxylate transporter receptor subunit TctC